MKNEPQFDERYRLSPRHVDNPGVEKRSRAVLHQQQQHLDRLRNRPRNIAYFEHAVRGENISDAAPLVGYFCNMTPPELIRAAGGVPVRLGCGNAALVQTGEEVLAGDICPLAKASFACVVDERSIASRCDAFVLPTSCDAKTKLGEILEDYRPTFMIHLPPEQNHELFLKETVKSYQRLEAFLGGVTGRKVSRKALLHAVRQGREQAGLVRRLQEIRSECPGALSVQDLFLMIQAASSGVDMEEWCRECRNVITEIEGYSPERRRFRHRVVLTGAPAIWPNFKPLSLLEECGADVVADTLCSGTESCYDPVVIDETGHKSLLRALSLRYVFASPCPAFISQGKRLNRVINLVDEFTADAVINYSLRLCQLFDAETYRLSQVLKQRQIPFMNMRTDYSLEDIEQLRVRLEAFLETLEEI